MNRHDERGAAVLEFALLGTLLLVVATALLPILQTVVAYNELSRATAEALRYAVHAEANPRPGTDDCPPLTRWPSAEQVRERIEDSLARPLDEFVLTPASPCLIGFDEDRQVTVTASVARDLGPLAGAANAIGGLFGEPPFPEQALTLTVTHVGLKE